MTNQYDDIIHLPHPVSKKHPQMSIADRAAQFSPFAALTGHDSAIRETARLTTEKIQLDENKKAELDMKLSVLQEKLRQQGQMPVITITFFVADEKKDGGCYETIAGKLQKIDGYERHLLLADGMAVAIDDILEMELQ